jgi:hypothetical protein
MIKNNEKKKKKVKGMGGVGGIVTDPLSSAFERDAAGGVPGGHYVLLDFF